MSRKIFQRILLGVAVFSLVVLLPIYIFKINTKSFSPEDTVIYKKGDLELEVFYNRPYKKDREIFGGLVPYNEVWRTGANEATTFKTNKDLLVDGSLLPAGIYTLWTIPMEESWKVIFNSEMYPWGITLEKIPSRLPEFDVLVVEVPVNRLYNTVEQFTISFNEGHDLIYMILAWDRTAVSVPLKEAEDAYEE